MPGDVIRRTAITRLSVSPAQETLLRRTTKHWREACQIAVDAGWPAPNSKGALQSHAYDRIRAETSLGSQHAILATHRAYEAIASVHGQPGETATKPTFTAPTITYDPRTLSLFDDDSVSLTTVEDRVRCDLVHASDDAGYQSKFLDDPSWSLAESTLCYRDGSWFLHLGFRRPRTPTTATENGTVLGVDLGIDNLAVTSTGDFFTGTPLDEYRRQRVRLQRRLQQTATRSAYRTLSTATTRLQRAATDYLHRVATEVVEIALAHECELIAFEELTGIQDRIPNLQRFQNWAFRTLIRFVRYKASAQDIGVVLIDPAQTSTGCSRIGCDSVSKRNRPEHTRFECRRCGYTVHADYNAARNIGLRAARRGHTSSRGQGASQCALKSGSLHPTRGFIPATEDYG